MASLAHVLQQIFTFDHLEGPCDLLKDWRGSICVDVGLSVRMSVVMLLAHDATHSFC